LSLDTRSPSVRVNSTATEKDRPAAKGRNKG
jgi:hypothetical protein